MNQLQLLRKAFDRGEQLTVLRAIYSYGIYGLSQRVGDLIAEGYPIRKEWLDIPSGKRVRLYRKQS